MGGKTFGFEATRVNREQYDRIRDDTIQALFPFTSAHICPTTISTVITDIKSITDKSSFGDIDILIDTSCVAVEDFLIKNKQYYFISRNNDNSIISLLNFDKVQIDLILVDNSDKFKTYQNYMNYNCVGNFMGKLAHGLSLKFGLASLLLPVKYDDQIVSQIVVSTNMKEICTILDLDYNVYQGGFKNLKNVFDFIMKSKYYNRSLFLIDELSSKNRQRNKKNKEYIKFLEYIDLYDTVPYKYNIVNVYEALLLFKNDTRIMIDYLFTMRAIEETKEKAKLFNGKLVQKETGLKNVELGYFIKSIKDKIDYTLPIPLQITKLFNDYKENGL